MIKIFIPMKHSIHNKPFVHFGIDSLVPDITLKELQITFIEYKLKFINSCNGVKIYELIKKTN